MRQTSYGAPMTNPDGDELLTTAQVGHLLGKSVRTIQRMAEAGELQVAHQLPGPNGPRLFRRSDVDAALRGAA